MLLQLSGTSILFNATFEPNSSLKSPSAETACLKFSYHALLLMSFGAVKHGRGIPDANILWSKISAQGRVQQTIPAILKTVVVSNTTKMKEATIIKYPAQEIILLKQDIG